MTAVALYKPFNVLSHFTGKPGQETLAAYISIPEVYAAGRLDKDSEGLLILTDDGALAARITSPRYKHPKVYYAQVEGLVDPAELQPLRSGIEIGDFRTRPAEAEIIAEPSLPERAVPVRDYHPTTWLKIVLREGKNRQVRRMTAKIGYPTLRLVRVAIGPVSLNGLAPGQWRYLTDREIRQLMPPGRGE